MLHIEILRLDFDWFFFMLYELCATYFQSQIGDKKKENSRRIQLVNRGMSERARRAHSHASIVLLLN